MDRMCCRQPKTNEGGIPRTGDREDPGAQVHGAGCHRPSPGAGEGVQGPG